MSKINPTLLTGLPIEKMLVGKLSVLGQHPTKGEVVSGIAKQPVSGSVTAEKDGFVTDAQGDLRAHGGSEKAIHHYPIDHYPFWKQQLGGHQLLDTAGAFGENFSTSSIVETDVYLGDIFEAGSAILQISQGRQPCWRLDLRFGIKGVSRIMQQTVKTGWYYRVLEPGQIEPGDKLKLVDRVCETWSVERILKLMFRSYPRETETSQKIDWVTEVLAMPFLSARWRVNLEERLSQLQSGQEEPNDSARLG